MYSEKLRLVKYCETCGKPMFCENPKYIVCDECASNLPDPMADFIEEMFGELPSDKDLK